MDELGEELSEHVKRMLPTSVGRGVTGTGIVTVADSIVSSNTAGQNGGGIFNAYTLNVNRTLLALQQPTFLRYSF